MDDKKVQELWLAFKDGNELGTFQEFKGFMSDPKNRADFHNAFKSTAELGDINQFEDYLGVKKKVSSQDSAFNWETGEIDFDKLSYTQPAAPPAVRISKPSVTEEGGIQINWDTGEVKKSAFERNKDSIYQLTVTDSTKQAFQEETQPVDSDVQDVTLAEAGMGLVESVNQGFYKQAVGGTLKGAGELITKAHNKIFKDNANVDESWLYQAGQAVQSAFSEGGIAEPTSTAELLNSDLGQIGAGLGQMTAMILTGGMSAEAAALSGVAKSKPLLEVAAKNMFSRPSMMGTMQIVGDGAEKIREEKSIVDQMDRDGYIKLNIQQGLDENAAGEKYDRLKSTSADDLISEMLPTWFMEGSTEGLMVGEWFKRFNKATNGSFGKVFMEKAKDVTIGTFEGAAQEALQTWMENATAKEVYDYTLETTEGMAQSAKVGGAVQFILETMSAALGVKNRNTSGDNKSFIEKAQEEIENRKELLAKNLDNALVETVKMDDVKAELNKKVEAGEITQDEAVAQAREIEVKKNAIQKIPEEQKTNPDVVETVVEKTKVDEEIVAKKEEIKNLDPAFQQDTKNEIAALEVKSAELAIQVAEKAGVTPDEKAVKLLEPKEGEPKKPVTTEPVAKEEPTKEPPTYEPVTSFEVGQTYRNEDFDRDYVFTGTKPDGTLMFDRMPRKGEAEVVKSIEAAPGTNFMKGFKQKVGAPQSPVIIDNMKSLLESTDVDLLTMEYERQEQQIEEKSKTWRENGKIKDSRAAEYNKMRDEQQKVLDRINDLTFVDISTTAFEKTLSEEERANYLEMDEIGHRMVAMNPKDGYKPYKVTEKEKRRYFELRKEYQVEFDKWASEQKPKQPVLPISSLQEPNQVIEAIAPPEPTAPEPTAPEPTNEAIVEEGDTLSPNVGKRLRGFYANSLKKMGGATPGQGVLAKIAKTDPQFYEPMSRSGNAQAVANEIDADGLDTVVQRAMMDNTGEPEGVVAARRIVSLIAIGDAMADANRANDTQALDIMRNQAKELERLLGKKGTEFGQALSMYAIYSQTPEGQLAARLRDVEEKRERTRIRMTEGGRQVGDVVDAIVADVAAEVGITKEEAERALANVFGKKKAQSAAKATIDKGKKEVEEARAAIRNIMLGRANVGLPIAQYAKAGKEFIKLFSGYAKIYKGNIQKIRTAFRKDVNDAGLNGTAAYEWLETNHPEITGPITDFHNKMLEAIVGFYNGDIKGDLKAALEKAGLTEQEAIAVSEDFAAQWGEEIAKKKASRLKQIVRAHVKSAKKARVIENGLLEAITIGGLNDDIIRRKLEEKYGIKSFTNEQINELNQMVMDMKDMPSRGQKFKQMREMMDYIHLHGGIDITSFFAATWYAKVLFSVKTMLSVTVGNEVNFWDNFVTHGLATEGGLYAMKESVKRVLQPITSRVGLAEGPYQDRGVWFGLAEGWRFIKTGEASREMKKVARSADLELVSRMSFMEAARDAVTSFANISNIFADVKNADSFREGMEAAMGIVSQLGTTGYLLAKAFAIPHSRVFKYSLRAISAADSLRYYSMLDFTLDRKAYNSAVAEGLEGKAAEARAKEIIGETFQESRAIYDQAVQEFTEYAAQRGKQLNEMFTDIDVAYRAREIAEERLDASWRANMERDASLQGQFDDAVQKVMQANPGISQAEAEKTARRIRQRYYNNQLSPTEQARFEAEKVALQNDPQGVMGKLAKLLSADFPAVFDEAINAPEPEPTGDQKVDEFNAARAKVKRGMAKVFKTYSSFMFPFMKTMANVVNMKIERFPVLGGAMKGVDAMFGVPSIDWNNSEQKRVFFARQIAGNIILLSVFAYIKSMEDDDDPVITLTGPKDFAKKQGEMETKAWKKETIVVGGKRFYFGDTPYAAVLGFMGVREDNLAYAKEGEDDWTTGTMTMALLTQMFTNASYMQTFSNLSTAMQEQDAAKFGAALASPVSGMASSGLQRDLDRWFSPELRDRATIENRFVGEMLSRTPFAANNLLDFRYNSIGEPIDPYKNESFFTQAIGLDKYISSTEVSNPIFEVLAEKKVRFKGIGKSIDILGTDATYQEKRDYTLFVGRYRNKMLSANLQAMKEMGQEQLEMQLDKTDSEAKRAAELFVLLQRKNKAKADEGQIEDISIEAIDRFINEYDPEMVKQDSEMFMEELRTEKPEVEVDESLFF